jgi:UDP-N-acetylmuramate-alanine ligase
LAGADGAFVVDIYGARESAELRASVSAHDLVAAVCELGARCEAVGAVGAVADVVVPTVGANDVVLLLGAGDIDQALGGLVDRL